MSKCSVILIQPSWNTVPNPPSPLTLLAATLFQLSLSSSGLVQYIPSHPSPPVPLPQRSESPTFKASPRTGICDMLLLPCLLSSALTSLPCNRRAAPRECSRQPAHTAHPHISNTPFPPVSQLCLFLLTFPLKSWWDPLHSSRPSRKSSETTAEN